MSLKPEVVKEACLRAADILSGMGYTGRYGSVHLLRLNLQSNTVTAILHNMVAWQISRLDKRWAFKPKGGPTPDLTNPQGVGVQLKQQATASLRVTKFPLTKDTT